jgi:DNA-binding NarL/FixJ family response regulator
MANAHKNGPDGPSKGLKPLEEIAKELSVSIRTVSYDYRHAMNKLRQDPKLFEILMFLKERKKA